MALCRSSEKPMSEIARDLDLTESSVRRWVSQAEIDAGRREGLTTDGREELARLRRENRVLREERMHSLLDYLTPVDYEARRRNLDEHQAAWRACVSERGRPIMMSWHSGRSGLIHRRRGPPRRDARAVHAAP